MFHKNFKIREVKCFKKGEKRCEMKAGIMLHIVTSQDFQNSKSIYMDFSIENARTNLEKKSP